MVSNKAYGSILVLGFNMAYQKINFSLLSYFRDNITMYNLIYFVATHTLYVLIVFLSFEMKL